MSQLLLPCVPIFRGGGSQNYPVKYCAGGQKAIFHDAQKKKKIYHDVYLHQEEFNAVKTVKTELVYIFVYKGPYKIGPKIYLLRRKPV